ncbi:MAG: hypothetical protein LC687_00830 [Actinobacteria bacterium]|nr:hypothetical protein [Actinomycetota bacterium]MCA1806400.1 hypothetical protein [Actinomycetota bacterium]
MTVEGNRPIVEAVARMLFGIETVPPKVAERMVNQTAIMAGEYVQGLEAEHARLREVISLLIGDGRVDVLTDNNYGSYMCFFCQGEEAHEGSGMVISHDKDCPVLAAQAALQGDSDETA